jgi:CHAD domain-containing protein
MALDSKRLLKPVRKLRKLVGNLDRQPAAEIVHDLRTNARRVEATFEALMLDTQGAGKSVMKDLRRCRKRAGRVRDMDVLTDYASRVHRPGEDECSVQLLEHLGARRKKYAAKLYAEVRRFRPALRKELKHAESMLAELIQTNGDSAGDSAVGPRAATAALTLAVQLAAPPRLDRGTLHPYRLKVKELRNILQMASGNSTRFVDDLAKVKDAIGEWHDWEVLLSIAQKELEDYRRCDLLAELRRITRHKYDDALALARTLRRNYLRSSHSRKARSSAPPSSIPREAVWEAIAMLAG